MTPRATALRRDVVRPAPRSGGGFLYKPAGTLVSGSGTGRVDSKIYAPGMRFPIEKAPAYANSQVWGTRWQQRARRGSVRRRELQLPLVGQLLRDAELDHAALPLRQGPPRARKFRAASCTKNVHSTSATTDGKISSIGTYSVYLTGNDGTVYRYLHMGSVAVSTGATVKPGQLLGKVSNEFGGTPTTVHLHFDLEQNVSGLGKILRSALHLAGPAVPRAGRQPWWRSSAPS